MKLFSRRLAGALLSLIALHPAALAQPSSSSIVAPFATPPVLAPNSSVIPVFLRQLDGTYVSIGLEYLSYSLVGSTDSLVQLLSEGLPNLMAAPAGPANVGRASQMAAGGSFTSGGALGVAFTTFTQNPVYVSILSADLAYNTPAQYNAGPFPAGVLAADFNGDGVLDLAVPIPEETSPGWLAILINNGDGTFKAPVNYTAGTSPQSVAALDLNGDGILDLAVADYGSSSVYVLLGNGDGTFKTPTPYPVSSGGLSVTLADLNGDGSPDIAESTSSGKISILFNTGNGTFRAGPSIATPGSSPVYIAAGDFRGAGMNDLVVADGNMSIITIFLNMGAGNFVIGNSYATSSSPNSLVITDFNGDGKLDILNATGDARAIGPSMSGVNNFDVFLGNGDGTFQGLSATPGGAETQFPFLAVADFTGDGVPDAVVAAPSSQNVALFPGTKTGAFQPPMNVPTNTTAPAGAAAGDFNNDGKQDLAITDYGSGKVAIVLNSASGFQAPTTFSSGGQGPTGIVAANFNGDGNLDLAVTNTSSATTAVFFGTGNGTFQLANSYNTGTAPDLVISADLNGDGRADLIVLDPGTTGVTNGALYVLINNGSGGFNAPVSYSPSAYPLSVSAGDVNGDGKPDLVVAVQDAQFNFHLAVLLNTGTGAFGPATLLNTEFGPSSIAIADFNGDGKADLAVAHCCGDLNLTYLQGNGNGTFSPEVDMNSGISPQLVQTTNFNGDAAPDLAIFLYASGPSGAMVGLLNDAAQQQSFSNVSAAAGVNALAPGSLATAFGTDLATRATSASSTPLPISLNGTSVLIVDSTGIPTPAPLIYVSPTQVNYLIPDGVATGVATITVTSGDGTPTTGQANLAAIAPALFTLNSSNLAAAIAVCATSSGGQVVENVYQVTNGAVVASPINLAGCSETVLELYATGMDAVSASNMKVTLGGVSVPVQFAGPQGSFVGLDQINVEIPASLAGSGNIPIVVSVSGQAANTVNLTIQ